MIKNEISIPQLQDFDGTLEELSRIINFFYYIKKINKMIKNLKKLDTVVQLWLNQLNITAISSNKMYKS